MDFPAAQPRHKRFESLGYGLFIHWGLYSQLGQGEWIMSRRALDKAEYAGLKDTFAAADFDAREIARFVRQAGMKYVCITTRHHEGFSLYDTRGLSDYDAPHSPAGRDLIAEFVEACRVEGLIPFFYHTTLDWYQESFNEDFDAYLEYLRKSVEVLCRNYGEIGGFWFDGNWSKPEADWKEDDLYGTIRKYQPEAMIINNTGLGHQGRTGHPELDSVTFEQGRPKPLNRAGMSKYVCAEMCQTMNDHWGIGDRDFNYKSPAEIITNLCACRKVGANYLLNVGPTAGGAIPDYERAALLRVGQWVEQNSEAIYKGRPCSLKGQGNDFALQCGAKIYLFIHDLSIAGNTHVTVAGGGIGPRSFTGLEREIQSARWIDNGEQIAFVEDVNEGLLTINATGYPYGTSMVVRVAELT